jgi:enterochelin esterase-like enzyme
MHLLAALFAAVALPGFTPVAPDPGGGALLAGTFPGTARPGYVYLPPGFDSSQRYPVVYLLHGMPGDPSEFVDSIQLASFADTGIGDGTLRPFIAVMPAAGTRARYDGEWAGPWERALVKRVVPWIDGRLPTIASPAGRIVAGLSAGGFGAVNMALRHPSVFGAAESWSGYFAPLRDGPFKDAGAETLAANDPVLLAPAEAPALRRDGTRFFLSTGPAHSHWIKPASTFAFARELRELRLPVDLQSYAEAKGDWRAQADAGLTWALAA